MYSITAVVTALLCTVSWAWLRWRRVRSFWAQRRVPHAAPHPVWGTLTFLLKINTGIWMRQLYAQYKKPYVGIWLFWRPALVVNSPEIVRNILVKDSAVFRDRFLRCGDKDPIGNMNLFCIKDPMWSVFRRHVSSTFSAARLRSLEDYVRTKTTELTQRISSNLNTRVELKELYLDYSTDIIGTIAFGVACNATLTGEDPIRTLAGQFASFNVLRGISWCCIFFLPNLVDVFRLKLLPESTTQNFRRIIRMVIADRGVNPDKWREHKDLLDILLRLNRENDTVYSEDFIISQATTFLIGGFDTTASALSFISYELAHYPDIQEKLYKELLKAKHKNGSDIFDSNFLAELKYLNCVIKEGLRKYPPMGWMDRLAASDYAVDDTLTIPAGTPVYLNAIGMHYDPEYFPNPERFDPDRFLPENEVNIKPYTYMPFGEGPRICIGLRFAQMTLRFALAAVCLNYKMEPCAGAPRPDDIKINNRGMFYMPGERMHIKFINRC